MVRALHQARPRKGVVSRTFVGTPCGADQVCASCLLLHMVSTAVEAGSVCL